MEVVFARIRAVDDQKIVLLAAFFTEIPRNEGHVTQRSQDDTGWSGMLRLLSC